MYKRVLLKLSGEALAADRGFGVDVGKLKRFRSRSWLSGTSGRGRHLVGGGNFFRGVAEQARMMDRVSADQMEVRYSVNS